MHKTSTTHHPIWRTAKTTVIQESPMIQITNDLFFPHGSFSPLGRYISKKWKLWNNKFALSDNAVDDMQIHNEIEYVLMLTVTIYIFENIFTNSYNWMIFYFNNARISELTSSNRTLVTKCCLLIFWYPIEAIVNKQNGLYL